MICVEFVCIISMIRTCYKCNEQKEEHLFKRNYNQHYKLKGEIRYTNCCLSCNRQDNRTWVENNRVESNKNAQTRRHSRKQRAVAYKGNVCVHCKQSFHFSAFDFHHVDTTTKHKDPGLMMTYSDEALFKELDKCILLCANCHRKHHFENGYG